MKKKIILNLNLDCEYIKLNDELSFFEIIKGSDSWLDENIQTTKGIGITTSVNKFLNNPTKENFKNIYGYKYKTQYKAILKTDLERGIENQLNEDEFKKLLHSPNHIGFNDKKWNVKNVEFIYIDEAKSAYTNNTQNILIKNIKNEIIYFSNKFYFRLTEAEGTETFKKFYLTELIKLQNKHKIFTQQSFECVMEKYIVDAKQAITDNMITNLKTKFDISHNNYLEVKVENKNEYQECYNIANEIYQNVKPIELKLEEIINIVLFERLNIYEKLGIVGESYRHLFLNIFLTDVESNNLDKCFLTMDLMKNLKNNDKLDKKLKL